MTDEEFQAAVEKLRSMSPEERAAWASRNYSTLSEDQVYVLMTSPDVAVPEMSTAIAEKRNETKVQTVAEQAREGSLAAGESEFAADTAARAAAQQAGGDPNQVAQPDWLLSPEVVQAVGWNTTDQESYDRALDTLQDLFPDAKDFDDALTKGYLQDELTRRLLSVAAAPEEDPNQLRGLMVRGAGFQTFVPQSTAAAAAEQFGLSEPALVKSVRQAEAWGFKTAAGEVAWQPYLALQKAYGTNIEPGNREEMLAELIPRREELKAQIKRMETSGRGSAPVYAELQRELADIEKRLASDRRTGAASLGGQREMMLKWNEGMKLYDSETLAFFHALNPALASRMSTQPDGLSLEDARMSLSLMAKAGLSGDDPTDFARNMGELGFLDPYATLLVEAQRKAAGGGGAGRTVLKPDPVAIRQATKDMYRSLYMEDPSDDALNAMAARVESAIVGAPDDVSVSGEARIRDVVESDPKYQQYYGNKPSGMSEQEYQDMHRSAQSSMLGAELADNQAVRVGMRQGDYQTTVGAAMGTEEAWDNSTFLGRLARAAQTVGRNT